ncbi:MAG: hypothetical protein ACOYYS_02100 [Chloroflexota bacterium]
MPLLTIFAAPKPFTNGHIATIQRNAVNSWKSLGPDVEVFLMGQEVGLAEAAAELGVRHFENVRLTKETKTPYVSSMIETARQNSGSPLLLCINADVILLPEFLEAARTLLVWQRDFLMVGPRWDLAVTELLEFGPGWDQRLRADALERGKTHPPLGSDYFLFPRDSFGDIPDFAMGRSAWDNWMIYHHRSRKLPVVNGTMAINVIHQNHDYSHLPGNKPPYQLPETMENIRLAGGRRRLLFLEDTDYQLAGGQPVRVPLRQRRLARLIETFPIIYLNSYALAEVTYFIFHPSKAWGEWRGRVGYKLNRLRSKK